ncbi:hypothetical protein BLNAU_3232 [Blattamonas nauphoetae]|uniref:Uncharacterized protein n=1 Tax=Blattamonas nauphoetae TaxID=2049346 RepID=A0ABQ9YDE8_9EUKA|nr:hypothetical protein BLNAU_3232 [Blattamonas nauphoetae]
MVVELTSLAGDGLKDNLISSLPKTLFTSTLTCLLLAHNLLTELPDGLFTLPNLRTLDVSFNSNAFIPPSISLLTLLVKGKFGFNNIEEVPNELFRLPTLTHLILSPYKLTSLPTDPAMSPKVELSLGFVDPLSNSMIYEKTGTGTHPGAVLCPLERLLLASNQLTSVPPLVSQFRKLHTLSLAGNGISELPRPFFRSLPNLSPHITADSASSAFVTLVSMVRNDFYFDKAHVNKASQFLSLTSGQFSAVNFAEDFLMAIGSGSPNSATVQEYSQLGVSTSHLVFVLKPTDRVLLQTRSPNAFHP